MIASPDSPPPIRIFIGESIENRSEHDCLRAVLDSLERMGNWGYIFANFHAGGRQIDLAVFTETATLVIEAKGYSVPVRGAINGPWEQIGPFGSRKIGNAYLQALSAKNALRNEIQKVVQTDGYPNGVVAVPPTVPPGSEVTLGDFKVAVIGLDQIPYWLGQPSGASLTRPLCEKLARQLGLEEVASIGAALDNEIPSTERLCDQYLNAFDDFYSPQAIELLSDQYSYGTDAVGVDYVQAMVASGDAGVLIHGPSGCGKTLLTMSCATSCIGTGSIPIFVSAKNYDGEFRRLVESEIALLGVASARKVIQASRLLEKGIVLFLDGYNECRDDLKTALTRSLRAFAMRYGARIVVSTQEELVRSDLLVMNVVTVKRPSEQLKAALAKAEQEGDQTTHLGSLLQVINSGLEARLVGQVGALLPAGASKAALFDMYTRQKLGTASSSGIRILSMFAETLVHRACFSLSLREFDRICHSTNTKDESQKLLLQSQLMHVQGDRVSFVHELFFEAFSAESAIRASGGSVTQIHAALASPRFFSSKAFILGGIEDERTLMEVLKDVADQDLLAACSRGECGVAAQSIVRNQIETVLNAMIDEAKNLEFQIVGEGWNSIEFVERSLHPDLEKFGAYQSPIGLGLMDGRYLDSIMAACRHMDDAIVHFSNEHADEAKAKKIPLRHEVFSAAYVMQRKAAITQLMYFFHSGGISLHREERPDCDAALLRAWSNAKTSSEYYCLLGLTKLSSCEKEVAQYVAMLLQGVKSLPYHFQLDLIDFAQYLSDAEEPYRSEIVEALEGSLDNLGIMMNSVIVEALKGMGVMDDAEYSHIPVIRNEIDNALSEGGRESDMAAWGLFSCQFDHPYDHEYWEEIQKLDDSKKKLLFTRACRGAETPYLSFLGILIRRLSEFNDTDVARAIARWATLPDRQSFMPQDAIEVFIIAHESLGRLGVELPQSRGEPAAATDRALLACGELYYWATRRNLTPAEVAAGTAPARSVLLDHGLCASAGALRLTASHMYASDEAQISLVKRYPDLCASVCIEALKRKDEQTSYFQHGFRDETDSIASFAIQVLGGVGEVDDLRVLRSLCDHQHLGVSALAAIKKIEERTRKKLSIAKHLRPN